MNARYTTNRMCAKNSIYMYVAVTTNNRAISSDDLLLWDHIGWTLAAKACSFARLPLGLSNRHRTSYFSTLSVSISQSSQKQPFHSYFRILKFCTERLNNLSRSWHLQATPEWQTRQWYSEEKCKGTRECLTIDQSHQPRPLACL